ncbi:NAD-dependent epimerase/dehydratase family protein [Sporosarcina sp. BI001-red]|uniref:NAD-dependent epimerase/dehydratase family protein n=1 Tax=Sporosarcina sp. BI001-red TaxID=2282866 RepID=UPI000E23519A|nr:NAD-dependent epimerase/dehydratase family protein [Sporosarcina sp. BI001-red]REB05515.1 NAD-dependent epimerase/dehydratase family protein [Sporosarcina sp. BI001-red]
MDKVFVLGGTGLLGLENINELLDKGYEVSTIARNEKVMAEVIPEQVKDRNIGDINKMTDEQVLDMLQGKDAFVYAAGLDERTLPKAPAMRFYYENNVLPTQRLARLARKSGIKKFVIFGSYHTETADMWTDLNLQEQPYVKTRLLQEEMAFMEGEGGMDVMSLRLPYIFGTMPHRTPLWKSFFPRVQGLDVVKVPAGGTAMVTTKQVAEAAVGALEHGKHRATYAISGINMKYEEFYKMIAESLGQTDTIIEIASLDQLKPSAEKMDETVAANGKEHAIHMGKQIEMQNRDAFIDPKVTMQTLKYEEDDVRDEIKRTLAVCAEEVE